ncbi:MAG: glutamate--tRNA ligase family protein [Phycisphaerae bacterium]
MDNSKMSKREKAKAVRTALKEPSFVKMLHEFKKTDALAEPDKTRNALDHYWPVVRKTTYGQTPDRYDRLANFLNAKDQSADYAIALAIAVNESFPAYRISIPEIDVQDFRRSGYLPEALLNFIALVGWAPGQDREIVTMDQMIELFSLSGIQKTNARFDRKKLAWMNGEYIRKSTLDRLADAVDSFNQVTDYPLKHASRETIKELLAMYQERMVTIAEMAENARFFFEDPATIDPKALEKFVKNGGGVEFLKQIKAILDPLSDWSKAALAEPMDKILNLGTETGGKRGAAAQPLRVALSGNTITPPMLETIALLGREKTLGRINKLLQSVGG